MKTKRPLGCTTVEAIWKNKRRKIEVTVGKNIRPEFIGGINVMTSFGIKLMDVLVLFSSINLIPTLQGTKRHLNMLGKNRMQR